MKRYRPPDNRLDWRDPNMPIEGKTKQHPPELRVKASRLSLANSIEPTWRNDPTYNLRRRRNANR